MVVIQEWVTVIADVAALDYQRQILAWQRAAARQPYVNPYTSYSLPFAVRG